jgi:hypothetical protein
MITGIADLLGDGREYYLFDSFEGLPPVKAIAGRLRPPDTTTIAEPQPMKRMCR